MHLEVPRVLCYYLVWFSEGFDDMALDFRISGVWDSTWEGRGWFLRTEGDLEEACLPCCRPLNV